MKAGLIAFPFAYLQLFHVTPLKAVVLQIGLLVIQDIDSVLFLGAVSLASAAGKWATPEVITSTTEIHWTS